MSPELKPGIQWQFVIESEVAGNKVKLVTRFPRQPLFTWAPRLCNHGVYILRNSLFFSKRTDENMHKSTNKTYSEHNSRDYQRTYLYNRSNFNIFIDLKSKNKVTTGKFQLGKTSMRWLYIFRFPVWMLNKTCIYSLNKIGDQNTASITV